MGAHRPDDQCAGRRHLECGEGPSRIHSVDGSLDGVRHHRLLIQRDDRGSAPIESLFALILLLFLMLGTIEVAFALYGRNVIASAAHEAARTAVELGRDPRDAAVVATNTVVRSAGGLTRDLNVVVDTDTGDGSVRVTVTGVVDAFGPIPFPFPVEAVATAHSTERPR